MAGRILMNEYKALSKEPWTRIELVNDNVYEWNVALIVLNPDSLYYQGYLMARMTFPRNYPYSPPDFRFLRPLYHPNIYPDGRLCISILHAPGDDAMSGELAAERWSPAQRVESVLISILSLLDDGEVSSPANVDAAIMLRRQPDAYQARVRADLERARDDIPPGFEMLSHVDVFGSAGDYARRKRELCDHEDEDLLGWADEDADGHSDFDEDGDENSDDDDDDDDDDDNNDDGDDEAGPAGAGPEQEPAGVVEAAR